MNTVSSCPSCPYCGLTHSIVCPRVKAMEYYSDGTVKRVEFHTPVPFDPSKFAVGRRLTNVLQCK